MLPEYPIPNMAWRNWTLACENFHLSSMVLITELQLVRIQERLDWSKDAHDMVDVLFDCVELGMEKNRE